MVYGIGTDILKKELIEILMHDREDPFFRKLYTEKELLEADQAVRPSDYLSGRFAAKEAIFKTFKVDGDAIHLRDIEILKAEVLVPFVNLHGKVKTLASELGITKIEVSISHETDYVIAYAIAIN